MSLNFKSLYIYLGHDIFDKLVLMGMSFFWVIQNSALSKKWENQLNLIPPYLWVLLVIVGLQWENLIKDLINVNTFRRLYCLF